MYCMILSMQSNTLCYHELQTTRRCSCTFLHHPAKQENSQADEGTAACTADPITAVLSLSTCDWMDKLPRTHRPRDRKTCSPLKFASSAWSWGQVCIWCGSFPVVVVGQHTIQHGLCLLKQLCHGLEQWNAHDAEETHLQHDIMSG